MTDFIPMDYDQLRAMLWLRPTMRDFEVATATALESLLRREDNICAQRSGNLSKIAAGKTLPFHKKGIGPHIYRCAWPDRALKVMQSRNAAKPAEGEVPASVDSLRTELTVIEEELGALKILFDLLLDPSKYFLLTSEGSRWLRTPFWFLQENAPTEAVLIECLSLLPEIFQEELLDPSSDERAGHAELAFVSRDCIYALTDPLGPEALGALACALRRAHLAGDTGAERWCSVGMAWMLIALDADAPPEVKLLLAQLTNIFLIDAAQYVYASGIQMDIQSHEVEKFNREREAFMAWTVEGQLIAGDRPSWIENGTPP